MQNPRVTDFWFGVLGVVQAVIGVLMVRFNRQLASAVPPPRGPEARLPLFQRGRNGRVPVLTIIGCGWVLMGAVLVWIAVTGQRR